MALTLPQNVKIGQVRRTVGIVSQAEWNTLSDDERAAADALALQVWWRCQQRQHPAFEGADGIFLTASHVQRLLRVVGARKSGEKAAAAAIATMLEHGWMQDTGRVKRPRRPKKSMDRAERFGAAAEAEGGRDSQPTMSRSFWWRVYCVPALAQVIASRTVSGAYGQLRAVPQRLASLSALLSRQGLIPRPRRRSRPSRGSVQWVFQHSGPP